MLKTGYDVYREMEDKIISETDMLEVNTNRMYFTNDKEELLHHYLHGLKRLEKIYQIKLAYLEGSE